MAQNGLKRIKRRQSASWYWIATKEAKALGYPIATMNLTSLDAADRDRRAEALQLEMNHWLAHQGKRERIYDGSFASLFDLYKTHEESRYHKLRASTRKVYNVYFRRLRDHIGDVQIPQTTGIDVSRWMRVWSDNGRTKAAATTARAALLSALAFGAMSKLPGCLELHQIVKFVKPERYGPREFAPTAEQIVRLRQEAHREGFPSLALCFAVQFETYIRLYDVLGEWVPLSEPEPSTIMTNSKKWIGMMWTAFGEDDIIRWIPRKTSRTTGKKVVIALSDCPMIEEELAHWPREMRHGPLIVSEKSGLPWRTQTFEENSIKLRKAAGWPQGMWIRDIRAGGLTESREGGATLDDAGQLAGHSKKHTTARVYDRDMVEAARRVKKAALSRRETSREQG